MTTQTTAINITTSSYVQNYNGNTVITAGAAVTNSYSLNQVITFANQQGTLDSTGTVAGDQSAGIDLSIGNVAGKQAIIGNGGGLITGYEYGIFLSANGATSNSAFVFNSGTIMSRAATYNSGANPDTAGIFAATGTNITISNSGLIEGAEGIFLESNDPSTQVIVNDAGAKILGTVATGEGLFGIKIRDTDNGLQGAGSVLNAGLITGAVEIEAKYAFITNTNTGTLTGGVGVFGTGTLALSAGGTFGGSADFNDGANFGVSLGLATLLLGPGTTGQVGILATTGNYLGFGSVTVQSGADWTIGKAGSTSGFATVSTISDFGTLNVAGQLSGNTINMEGSVAGASSVVDFTGSNSATPLTDFSTNDEIIVATLSSAAGNNYKDAYSAGVLTITEYNAAGTSIGSEVITVSGTTAAALNAGSFVNIGGPGGDTIVIGSTSLSNTGSIYIDNGESVTLSNTSGVDTVPVTFGAHGTSLALNTLDLNGTFSGTVTGFGLNDDIVLGPSVLPSQILGGQDVLSYAGSLLTVTELNASGATIGSTTINVGTGYSTGSFLALFGTNGVNIETPATVDETPLTFNATGTANIETVTDYSGGLAPGSSLVTGETLIIASGTAAVSTTAPITNSGTIVVAGASAAFLDAGTLSGTGTIVAKGGGTVTLATDSNTVDFGATAAGALNVLDLTGSATAFSGAIGGFGTGDDIIIGPSAIPGDASWNGSFGDYVSLSYAGSLLTVAELNSGGTVIGSTTLNVGTGYSVGSFVALYGTNGINIETPATVDAQNFTLIGTGGSSIEFVDPAGYAGKLSPGDSIIAGETVTVNTGAGDIVELQNPVNNAGVILLNGSTMLNNLNLAGGSNLTGNGTIVLQNGGFFEQGPSTGSTSNTIAFGAGSGSATNILDINSGSSVFSSPILGFGANDEILLGTMSLPATGAGSMLSETYNAGTGALVITETNASGTIVGTETLNIANTGSLSTSSFVVVGDGSGGVKILLGSSPLLSTTGSIFIDHGMSVTLNNTSAVDTIPVTFGSNGTSLALNVLDLNGTVSGTNSPYQGAISGFGLNDDIILGPSVLPSVATGDTVTLSYTGSLLTVTELNSGGTAIGATTLNVGTGYAAGAFVALLGTNGVNLETPQTVDEQKFVFGALTQGTNYQGDFENPNDYQGGLAPGATIVAGETVTVQEPAQANVTTALTNNGLIVLDAFNSNMDATAAISGTGTIEVGSSSNLVLANSIGSTTDTIAFAGSGLLELAGTGTASFTGTITGEDQTDTIEIGGSVLPTPSSASAISLSFNTSTGVLSIFDTVGGSVVTETLHFAGPVSNNFSAAVSNGFIVISDVPCFAAGTRILTVWGSRKVEELAIGDEVLSARDGRSRKIIWAGRRTVDISRHAMPDKVIPVLIAAGAFGPGLPERDLRVSPDHALYIDGHLIEAKTLVNGATIIRDRAARLVTYHHIELETHDVVLAEGLPAETYLDSGNRRNFESDAGPLALHPDFAAAARAGACADLLLDGEIVRHARQALLDRALELGFRRTRAIDLVAQIDGELITPYVDDSGRELMFVLPAGAATVTLLSSAGVPAETSADPGDRRVLGAAIVGLALIVGGRRIEIGLNAPHAGFHDAEAGQRWTNGKATIALPAYAGRAVLEATLAGQAARWLAPVAIREFVNA
jgi:hypothetical protein